VGRIRKPPVPHATQALSKPIYDEAGSATFAPQEIGERELEIIHRLLEKQEPKDIRRDMGLTAPDLDALLLAPRFQREFELQSKIADRTINKRMERLASEALDVVRDVMRTAVSPSNRLKAALEILDRSGYVKVEKRLTVTADAESIIRELNRMGTAPKAHDQVTQGVPHPADDGVVPHPTNGGDDIEDAEFTEIAGAVADAQAEGRLDQNPEGAA
jgi:hypothetical protein